MFLPSGIIALDLARERTRELQREAEHRRLLAEARAARAQAAVAQPRRPRVVAARLVRWFSDAAQALSDTACSVATRLEGRSA